MLRPRTAQTGAMSPYQGEYDGVSAGGQWLEFRSDDKMTGAKKVRFELQSNNYFREDPNYKPRVNLLCENGKLGLADFNPGVRLPPRTAPASGDSLNSRSWSGWTASITTRAGTGNAAISFPWTKAPRVA